MITVLSFPKTPDGLKRIALLSSGRNFKKEDLIQTPEICQCIRNCFQNSAYYRTCFQLITLSAGAVSPGINTFPYFTHAAIAELCPFFPAPGTVYHFRSNIGIKSNSPFFSSRFPEFVVIVYCCNPCITGCTVQSATRDYFFHTFMILIVSLI